MDLPADLAFLEDVLLDSREKYRQVAWLLCDFDDPVWIYTFGFKEPKFLDWNVTLDDGKSLLNSKHRGLLDSFKYWLTIVTRPKDGSSSAANSLKTQQIQFSNVIRYIDHFLDNSAHYELSVHGLSALSRDDLKAILEKIAAKRETAESLFDWSGRLSKYLMAELKKTDQSEIAETLNYNPDLYNFSHVENEKNYLDIPNESIPAIRALLLNRGLYESRDKGLVPNSVKLSAAIYPNTLRIKGEAKHSFSVLEVPKEGGAYKREYPAVPVSTRDDSDLMSQLNYRVYKENLYAMGKLHDIDVAAPDVEELIEIARYQPSVNAMGRFRTLPSSVIFGAVRNGIELHLEYGKAIIDSYISLSTYCVENDVTPTSLTDAKLTSLLDPALHNLGVCKLGLSARKPGTGPSYVRKNESSTHYKNLRELPGLVEIMSIYIGSVQLVVGALMARRMGELGDLVAGQCLDVTKKWLIFENRKSTRALMGLRQTEARPIEPIASSMVEQLERLQAALLELGVIDELTNLFATPPITGELRLSYSGKSTYHRNFDIFCDYFETALSADNRRYYIRQHQLRRFFAMLFFYSSSFGGLETLQWMLGHTDREHVWRYITETSDGAALRGPKAQFVAENIQHNGSQHYTELAALIEDRFGTDEFHLVDLQEMEDYIVSLMEEGKIEIEPEFFEDENGKQMRIMTKVVEAV